MDISTITPNVDAAKDGVWIDFDDNVSVKLAYQGGGDYERRLAKAIEPLTNRRKRKNADIGKIKAIQNKLLAENIILDWKGFTDGENDYPCNPENALALLKRAPEFRDFVIVESEDVANFNNVEEDEADLEATFPVDQTPDDS